MKLDIPTSNIEKLNDNQESLLVNKLLESQIDDKLEDSFFLETENKANLFKSYFIRLLQETVFDDELEYDSLAEAIENSIDLIDLVESYESNYNIADLYLYNDEELLENELTNQINFVSKSIKEKVREELFEAIHTEDRKEAEDNFLYMLFENIKEDSLKRDGEMVIETNEAIKKAVKIAKLREVFNVLNIKFKTKSPMELEEKLIKPILDIIDTNTI